MLQYIYGKDSDEEKNNALINGFNRLVPYIEETTADNYLLLFATIVQLLQDRGFTTNDAVIKKKIEIYYKFIGNHKKGRTDDDFFEYMLDLMYGNLGFIFVEGKELERNDTNACIMFAIAYNRGMRSAGRYMQSFEELPDGSYRFTGWN